jgi:hypothetical protein
MAGIQAMVDILVYEIFWKNGDKCIYKINNVGAVVGNAQSIIAPNHNSNSDKETTTKEVGDSVSDTGDTDEDIDANQHVMESDLTTLLPILQDRKLMLHLKKLIQQNGLNRYCTLD